MLSRFIALITLFTFFPIFILIVFIIIIEDGYPVFFKQKRVGRNNKIFYIYKFRTMLKDTPNVATHLLVDPKKYMLKSGSILRKSSLDELPNLINILKGEMAFVGPRPVLYKEKDLIKLRNKAGVSRLMPGITGWAQVNGRDELMLEEKVRYEKVYMLNKSFFLDLKIIIMTFTKVLTSKGVNH